MERKHVIVIGAGPAGLAAALGALEGGASVTVLEHMPEPAQKLLLTGNGRCNFTNSDQSPEHYHGDPGLVGRVLEGFTAEDALAFMRRLGIEPAGRSYRFGPEIYYYPASEKASSVRDALLDAVYRQGGELICGCQVTGVAETEEKPDQEMADRPDGPRIHEWSSGNQETGLNSGKQMTDPASGKQMTDQASGKSLVLKGSRGKEKKRFTVSTSLGDFPADRIIFATGSNAAPKTGSDSSIYPVLKKLGIVQKQWLPALCAIRSDAPVLRELKGLRGDAEAVLVNETDERLRQSRTGEVQFNEHSVSGIPVMQLSRYASLGRKAGHRMSLRIRLQTVNNRNGKIDHPEVIELPVTGTDGFEKAQCCCGGIEAAQIDPGTMESRKIPGLYFAGEMIDVDGDCGGYNLHFAFATGLTAGRNAAK